jgi:hypothetical protein
MKRAAFIIPGGVALAALAWWVSYFVGSAPTCCLLREPAPELAWLQREFKVSNHDLVRIKQLHDDYASDCAGRCRNIDAKSTVLKGLLAATNSVTPQIEGALREIALLRVECQVAMLRHFYVVSQTMPPPQAHRYLDWVTTRTLGAGHSAMMSSPLPAGNEHPAH